MAAQMCFEIPASLVKNRLGYSMDIGGSLIKVVYTEPSTESILIHCVTFQADSLVDALSVLKEKTKDYPRIPRVALTGISCIKYKDLLVQELDAEIDILLEFDCIVDAFKLLVERFPLAEVTHPISPKARKYAESVAYSMYECQEYQHHVVGARQKPWKRVQRVENPLTRVQYPVLLGVSGSASNILKVDAEGTYTCLDVVVAAGKQLLGLGSLLAGAKSYDELASLAGNGDAGSLDIQGKHLKLPSQDDIYSKYPDHNTVFSFGHVNGHSIDAYKREDRAAAVVSTVVQTLALGYHHWAMLLGTPQAFFCGGVTEYSEYIREEMAKYFECRCTGNALGIHTDYYFMKYGAHLGAIGGLLVNLNKGYKDSPIYQK